MTNISFDNPYLLLLIIPLVLLILIPYLIAIRKENRTKGAVIALVCHLAIAVLAVLAAAGMKHITVMTKTEVYVLADVSDSTSKKTELIDGYIKELPEKLPKNSEIGVVTFAADCKLHTKLGDKFTTVENSGVDNSATDILSALNFVSELFSDNTVKRLVVYTDGMSTDPDVNSGIIRAIENLNEANVYVDVVYIDSNLSEGESEIQISEVEFNSSTYKGNDTAANVLIESTVEAGVIVNLKRNGENYLQKTANITPGYNIVNLELATDKVGEQDYTVSIHSVSDTSEYNNSMMFSQNVNEFISVMLVTDKAEDVETVKSLYGENAKIDAYVKPQPKGSGRAEQFNVPFTVEDLCMYDEYVLSNVKTEEINNADTFISSLDICVSVFGKSLVTAGDNNLNNNNAQCVEKLNNMLPVNFGNTDADPKLYTIVIDASRSMEFKNFDFFKMAKTASKHLLELLKEGDYFAVVYFSGEVYVPVTPVEANRKNIEEAVNIIDGLEVTQGTMIGRALDRVYEMLSSYQSFTDKQVMLISDGMSYEGGEVYADDPIASAAKLKNSGITVSALNAGNIEGVSSMQSIAASGGGKYYFSQSSADLDGVMFNQVADDITETFVEGKTEVIINRPNDSVLGGVGELPDIYAYMYSKTKSSAENVLSVNYKKSGGTVIKVPLYSYWNYGNGKVSTLTTNLGGDWISDWAEGEGKTFLENIARTNTPDMRVDYPYTVETAFDGKTVHIEIIPAVVNPDAVMTVSVTLPDGTALTEKLVFDSYRYFYNFETRAVGKYKIDTTYEWSTKQYSSSSVFSISYSPEYNSFASYSPAVLHTLVRNNGTVSEDGNAQFKTEETKLDTYVIRFTVPFLAAAAALYVIDTVIRKLRWADIVSYFKKLKRRAAK